MAVYTVDDIKNLVEENGRLKSEIAKLKNIINTMQKEENDSFRQCPACGMYSEGYHNKCQNCGLYFDDKDGK